MIFDELKNYKQYTNLKESFRQAFEFLANSDFSKLEDGRYEIEGNKVYANVQTKKTKQKEFKEWEVHKNYIDIQYVIKGRERIGFGILKDFLEVVSEYDSAKDVEFLNGEKSNFVDVEEGNFVIFFPNDVHAPLLSTKDDIEIRKVIVKIAV